MGPDVDVGKFDSVVGDQKLADLVGVVHAARLDHVHDPIDLAVAMNGLDDDSGVGERLDQLFGQRPIRLAAQAGEHGRDASLLQEVDLSDQHFGDDVSGCGVQHIRDWIDDHHRGIEFGHDALHRKEVRLEVDQAAYAMDLQGARIEPLLQIDAN